MSRTVQRLAKDVLRMVSSVDMVHLQAGGGASQATSFRLRECRHDIQVHSACGVLLLGALRRKRDGFDIRRRKVLPLYPQCLPHLQ